MISVPHNEPLAAAPDRSPGALSFSTAVYGMVLSGMFLSSLTVFVPAVLFDCAWRNGRRSAAIALAGATAFMTLLAIAIRLAQTPPIGPHDLALNLGLMLQDVLVLGVPSLLVLPLVQRGEAFGRVLMTAIIAGVIGMGVVELITQVTAGVSPFATEYAVTRDTSAASIKTLPADTQQLARHLADGLLYCFAALRTIRVVVTYTLSLVLFGRLQAWREFMLTREAAVPVRYVFRRMVLPEWLLLVFVAAGLSPLATGALRHAGWNVIAVVGFLYLLQGLSILRWMITAMGITFLGALFTYATLLLLLPMGVSPLLLTVAGLFDSFFDYRHFNRKDSTHEDHSD